MANDRKLFSRKRTVRPKEMSATEIINNSKFFRSINSRRNSTSSAGSQAQSYGISNQYGYGRNSLVAANASQFAGRTAAVAGHPNGRRLSSSAAINVRRCQSMRQSHNGLFYDPDEEYFDEDIPRYSKEVTYNAGLSSRRTSQVDGGYHSNGSLTSSDSYSSYTKYNGNKDNPLNAIRVHIVDDPTHCLESKLRMRTDLLRYSGREITFH